MSHLGSIQGARTSILQEMFHPAKLNRGWGAGLDKLNTEGNLKYSDFDE